MADSLSCALIWGLCLGLRIRRGALVFDHGWGNGRCAGFSVLLLLLLLCRFVSAALDPVFKATQPFAQSFAKLWQLAGAKDEDRDDGNDDEVGRCEEIIKHGEKSSRALLVGPGRDGSVVSIVSQVGQNWLF